MTGYPDLDPIAAMLDALTARDDRDSPAWNDAARSIWIALNPIVDARDRMEPWLHSAWTWLGDHPDDEQYGERLKKWLLTSAKHTAYSNFLASAHDTLTASTRSEASASSDGGNSIEAPSTLPMTLPVNGPNTATTGTPEPDGSLITRVRGIRRSSLSDAQSATA